MEKLLEALESVSISSRISTSLNFKSLEGTANVDKETLGKIIEVASLDGFFGASKTKNLSELRTLIEQLCTDNNGVVPNPTIITTIIAKVVLALKTLKNKFGVAIFSVTENTLTLRSTFSNVVFVNDESKESADEETEETNINDGEAGSLEKTKGEDIDAGDEGDIESGDPDETETKDGDEGKDANTGDPDETVNDEIDPDETEETKDDDSDTGDEGKDANPDLNDDETKDGDPDDETKDANTGDDSGLNGDETKDDDSDTGDEGKDANTGDPDETVNDEKS